MLYLMNWVLLLHVNIHCKPNEAWCCTILLWNFNTMMKIVPSINTLKTNLKANQDVIVNVTHILLFYSCKSFLFVSINSKDLPNYFISCHFLLCLAEAWTLGYTLISGGERIQIGDQQLEAIFAPVWNIIFLSCGCFCTSSECFSIQISLS